MKAPMLSEAEVERMLDKYDYRDEMLAMKELWRYYENLIASGKLRAVGTVKRLQVQEHAHGFLDRCSGCRAVLSPMDVWCPGCGEKIEA